MAVCETAIASASSNQPVKILFLSFIALVIPAFFSLVFILSTHSKLTALRNRCREARERAEAGDAKLSVSVESSSSSAAIDAQRAYLAAVENYESARTVFPASLIAMAFGFRGIEVQSVQDSRKTPQSPVG